MKCRTKYDRVRVVCSTPHKGEQGDMTDETMAANTSIPSILARYGGNLAEIARWKGVYGTQNENNLEDVIEQLDNASALAKSHGFASLDDAIKAINEGKFGNEVSASEVVGKDVGNAPAVSEKDDGASAEKTEGEDK